MPQSTLQGAIKAGQGIVVNVANGGHWVLVTGYAGGSTYLVNDPGRTVGSYPYTEMVRFSLLCPVFASCLLSSVAFARAVVRFAHMLFDVVVVCVSCAEQLRCVRLKQVVAPTVFRYSELLFSFPS
jgi:hypothetical protein